MTYQLAMWLPGGTEMIVILVVALLIFGRRLPEVARSMGKSIVEFKRGLNDVKDEIDRASQSDKPKQISNGDDNSSPTGSSRDGTGDSHAQGVAGTGMKETGAKEKEPVGKSD